MFCPQCGIVPSDTLNFCSSCGANLQAVRQAMVSGGDASEFDWSKTWVATMFLSGAERKLREEELERRRGITPEIKRAKEMKAGAITACVGVGVSIVLFILMQGIVAGAPLTPGVAEILSRLWVVGVIPLMVGVGLIVGGLGASKRLIGDGSGALRTGRPRPDSGAQPALSSPTTGTLSTPDDCSVTEGTTRRLDRPFYD